MHKALRCTCSQKSPLPFPLLPNQLWYNSITFCWIFVFVFAILSSRCWLKWSVLVFVPRFICITPQIISLSISSCGASLLITAVRLMDLWILDLLLPHSSNISLVLVPSSFFPLLSFSCLLFVADCHVNLSPFLSSLHSHFVDCCVIFFSRLPLTKSLFPFSSVL